jgi:DNA-binding transcriptional LysR family regulator
MNQLERYELFICVTQSQSLTAAAEKLGLTKATLSKQIKRLESELQIDLFSRSGYRLELTPFGEVFLEQCKHLQHALDDTRSMAQQFHNKPQGALHITAFGYFARHLIFPRLSEFQKKYPDLKLVIDLEERVPNFAKENCDIALGFSLPTPNQEDIIQSSMGTTSYVLCASPDYFKQYGTPQNLEDLKQHQLISHVGRKNHHLKFNQEMHFPIEPSLYVNRVEAMIECALLGLGLVQLPIYMLKKYLDSKQLIAALPELQKQNGHIYYYFPKYRHTQPKIRAFIDFFLNDRNNYNQTSTC